MSRQLTDTEREFIRNAALLGSALAGLIEANTDESKYAEYEPLLDKMNAEFDRIGPEVSAADAGSIIDDTLLSIAAAAAASIEDYFGGVDSDGSDSQ